MRRCGHVFTSHGIPTIKNIRPDKKYAELKVHVKRCPELQVNIHQILEDRIARLNLEDDERDQYFGYWDLLTEEQLLVFRQELEFKEAESCHQE